MQKVFIVSDYFDEETLYLSKRRVKYCMDQTEVELTKEELRRIEKAFKEYSAVQTMLEQKRIGKCTIIPIGPFLSDNG